MNIGAMILSDLRKKEAAAAAALDKIRAALAVYGGTSTTTAEAPVKTRKRRRKTPTPDPVTGLTPIQKAQAARKANIAARKAQEAGTDEQATQPHAVKESRPRLPVGPGETKVPKGASLAEAAS